MHLALQFIHLLFAQWKGVCPEAIVKKEQQELDRESAATLMESCI